MRIFATAAAIALLAGCSDPHAADITADLNAAAAQAQGDIDTYAANTMANMPQPRQTPPTRATGSPTAGLSPVAEREREPVAEDPAQVVRSYFALIAARDYDHAWQLWDNAGQASGVTRQAFAASFAKYAEYRAEVGTPGPVEAGAGQLYVEVPVRAFGKLIDGNRPFAMRGSVTLHRTADIDGATAAQRSWHIRDSALQPRPAEVSATAPETYRCAGVTRVSTRNDDVRAPGSLWYRAERGESLAEGKFPADDAIPCSKGG